MKILFLVNHLNIGGITSYILNLSSGLKQRGHSIYIASSGLGLLPKFKDLGIEYIPIPIKTKNELSPKIILSAFKLSKVIKDNKIDIVHSHSRTTQVLGCLLDKLTGVKHISTCHGFFKRRLARRIFPCWGRRVIAISEQVKEHLNNDFKVGLNRISLVYNGIDTDRFKRFSVSDKEKAKLSLGLRPGVVVGIVARLSDVKGHKYLIEAMKPVLGLYPDAQLLIAGEGKMKEELVRLTESLNIKKSVFFIPEALDTRTILAAMDIFVMPSLKEGLGLALMEAMASGLAVIGSRVGGIKTLITEAKNGLLFEPADTGGLKEAIITLLADPGKREALAKEAGEFIKNNFSKDKMALETERVYQEIINESAGE